MGEKIDSLFFQRNPEFLEDLKEPFSSVEAKEIFELLKKTHTLLIVEQVWVQT